MIKPLQLLEGPHDTMGIVTQHVKFSPTHGSQHTPPTEGEFKPRKKRRRTLVSEKNELTPYHVLSVLFLTPECVYFNSCLLAQ